MNTKITATSALLVGLAVATPAVLALANEGTDRPPSNAQLTSGFAVAPATATDAEQRAAFRILRRERRSSDEMSPAARETLGTRSMSGRNNHLSRAIETPNGVGWVVPARSAICLVVPDPGAGYGVSCQQNAAARQGALILTLTTPGDPVVEVVGLVPDDTRVTSATFSDGSSRTLGTSPDGAISETLREPRSLSVATPSGSHEEDISPLVERAITVDCGEGRFVAVDSPREIGDACS